MADAEVDMEREDFRAAAKRNQIRWYVVVAAVLGSMWYGWHSHDSSFYWIAFIGLLFETFNLLWNAIWVFGELALEVVRILRAIRDNAARTTS